MVLWTFILWNILEELHTYTPLQNCKRQNFFFQYIDAQSIDAQICIFHVYLCGFKLKISLFVTFDWIVTQRWVRGQSGGSWGWQTQLDHSQVCSTCISRVYTCMHVKYTCIHVKYTCYKPGNGLVMLAILKNPYFDPSHNSVASEIFLSLLLKNDPCLKNGTLKLFLGNFWPRNKYYPII